MTAAVKKVVIAFLILLILVASFVYYNNYISQSQADAIGIALERREQPTETPQAPDLAEPDLIKLHVAGAVNSPGLYEAPAGSRVADLIALAGGSGEDANLDAINLAAIVSDGQQVFVPRFPVDAEGYIGEGAANNMVYAADTGLVNINTAGLEELKSLPGIGDVLSKAIVEYRDKNGGFRRIEDIKNVSGIGEKRYDQIKGLITVK